MKKSEVKKWVEALRSGEFKQTTEGLLCVEDEIDGESYYCCLGVACDVLVDANWQTDQYSNVWSIGPFAEFPLSKNLDPHKWGGAATTSFPSPSILEKIGLDVAYAQELAELNDNGWSFKKIANKIEKDLL